MEAVGGVAAYLVWREMQSFPSLALKIFWWEVFSLPTDTALQRGQSQLHKSYRGTEPAANIGQGGRASCIHGTGGDKSNCIHMKGGQSQLHK